jgi:hypothetical protein
MTAGSAFRAVKDHGAMLEVNAKTERFHRQGRRSRMSCT